MNCYKCNTELDLQEGASIGRHEECDKCAASLRVCKMCIHYDPQSYNECREPIAERIIDKEKANFCDLFSLTGNSGQYSSSKESLLSAADALFKK